MSYQFDTYELDAKRAELRRSGTPLKLESKVYLLLEILLVHHDRVVSKDEIIKHVWAGRIVSDGSIDNTLSTARKAIGDNGKTQKLIKTFPGTGFRFIGDVKVTSDNKQTIDNTTQDASIAVLPFVDMSAHGDQKYLGDGIAEELLNVLTNIGSLSVASRTSAFSFRDKTVTVGEIGEALQVGYILEGSIRKSENALRITAQLVDTRTDKHIFSKTYDRTFSTENLLSIQDDITEKIVEQLHLKLNLSDENTLFQPSSVEIYELYLRARTLMREKKPEELQRAVKLYKQILELEPNYVSAYSGLVQAYDLMSFYADMGQAEAATNMRPYVERGMVLAPSRPDILTSAGTYAMYQMRREDAVLLFEQAIKINPKHAYAYEMHGLALKKLGRNNQALKSYEGALIYDPISPSILSSISNLRYRAGDFKGASEAANINLKWNREAAPTLHMMAIFRRHRADYVGAHDFLVKAAKINPDEYFVQTDLTKLFLNIGLDKQALEAAKRPGIKATVHALLGDIQTAKELAKVDPSNYESGYAAYLLSDYEMAYSAFHKEISPYGLTKTGNFSPYDGPWLTVCAYVMIQQGDEGAQMFLNNLEKSLEGISPNTAKFPEENLGASALHMIRGKSDEALRWLDPLIDKGHVYLKLTHEPIFAPLASHPGFAARLDRMQKTAKKYRTVIKQQLQ